MAFGYDFDSLAISCFLIFLIWIFRDSIITHPYKMYIAWTINKMSIDEKRDLKARKQGLFQVVQNYRRQLKRELTVLEIGAGSVTNLDFLPGNTKLICLEYNQYFRRYATENIKDHDKQTAVEFVEGNAEDMPFESESFDIIVSTMVLCCVKDVEKCLSEIKRVLKPGGKFIFLEHVALEDKSSWGYTIQAVMNPVNQLIYDGCRSTRDTGVHIRAAGFSEVISESFVQETFPLWLRPCISGVATK